MIRRTLSTGLAVLALALTIRALGAEESSSRFRYPADSYVEQTTGRAGGVLHTSASYVPGSFDLHRANSGNLLWQGRLVCDNLVYLTPSGEPAPWLATSWTVSADGLIYTFHLREDVTFSDGARFDAEAVRVNFERIKRLGSQSRISATYLAPYTEGQVRGPFIFEAHLEYPFPAFLSYLAQTWLGFISPRQIQENPGSIDTRPIGTGPFIVSEYIPNQRAVFTRRPDYAWAPPVLRHSGPAYLESVILDSVPDDPTRTAELRSSRHQLCFEAPLGDAPDLRAAPQLAVSNRIRPGSPMRSLAFNPRRFPFNDVRLRRAVALAIDREALTRLIGTGEFIAKSDYLGANTPDYDPSFQNVLAYNPTAAAALLDEAGWNTRDTEGYRVKDNRRLSAELVTTGTERTPPASVLAIQTQLKNIGFELRLVPVSSASLPDLVRAGNYDALPGGWWTGATADVLFILYHSSQIVRQNTFGQDTARIADSALDEVLLRARQTPDPTQRRLHYREAQRLLTELVPVVPLHESHHVIAYQHYVRGLLFDTVHETPLLTTVWLDETNR